MFKTKILCERNDCKYNDSGCVDGACRCQLNRIDIGINGCANYNQKDYSEWSTEYQGGIRL